MLNKLVYTCLAMVVIASGCKTTRQTSAPSPSTMNKQLPVPALYRASNPIINELVHTKADVRFDWTKQYLYGKATLTLKPHFYSTQSLVLNARGITINEVSMLNDNIRSPLIYVYRNDSLIISLDKLYKRDELYNVFIDYISKPEELKSIGGSDAISSDKGLYFINPLGKDTTKPRQIWTQGETQANSVWLPTIDAPNQKMTHEINITVDTSFVTLSNGLMVKTVDNGNGTRTDSWKQSLPNSPYLVMMAIGNYAVVKDKWRNMEVSYYVDPEYSKVARKIFGNTPEMLEFFSKTLGVDYPWEKYSQVIARDYVSGAMENTTATVHGEFLQQNERQLLDYTGEDVISHELFHHWFGDLVTCESWSNLALNESFATYGEYLWNEYKYGRDEADANLNNDLSSYMREAKTKQVNLIRFQYSKQEDMFDRHSYQKGGRILHMLRSYVGDDAFFASLKLYLNQNRFQPAEVNHLRLAFEQVTGEDLNWFFDQWFLDKGHPVLDITYRWDEAKKEQRITIEQQQDFSTTPLYKLPMQIAVHVEGKVKVERIVLDSVRQEFVFNCNTKPDLVNTDAQKMLLCSKTDHHTNEEWMYLYQHGTLFMDRLEALQKISKSYMELTAESNLMMSALNDPHPNLRMLAIKNSGVLAQSSDSTKLKNKLVQLSKNDPNSGVRNEALMAFAKYFNDPAIITLLQSAIKDSSYLVAGTALTLFAEHDEKEGLQFARTLQKENDVHWSDDISEVISRYGNDDDEVFMLTALDKAPDGFAKYQAVQTYGKFLVRCKNESTISGGLDKIDVIAKTTESWFVRLAVMQTLAELSNKYAEQKGDDKPMYDSLKKKANELFTNLKKNEKDPNILKIIEG